jgi:conjugal transfer pilin signal peptidase TrbI
MRWRGLIRAGKPWPIFTVQCLLVLLVILAGGHWLMSRYAIGVTPAGAKPCIPGRYFLIERKLEGREPDLKRGDVILFRTDDRTLPHFRPGLRFAKYVRGTAGDRVVIDPKGKVHVMGRDYYFSTALEAPVVQRKGCKMEDCKADYTVAPGSFFVMGTLPDSFDSRYWGPVHGNQVVGKALLVW